MTRTLSLETAGATLACDVRDPQPPEDGPPPLFLVGAPMDASGFTTPTSHFTDRTVVTYDPRGMGRSIRHDGSAENSPQQHAEDLHNIIVALGAGPVAMFAPTRTPTTEGASRRGWPGSSP